MAAKSDKLFQRRRKTAKALARKKPDTDPEYRVLIVCEGELTEVGYFEHIRALLSLPNIDIDVCGKECGSSPRDVVDYAKKAIRTEGDYKTGGYDYVYCVFDKDNHTTFEAAKSQILSLNKPKARFGARKISAIWSDPCFEVWLLFHLDYTRQLFTNTGNKTASQQVASKLRQYEDFNDYRKGLSNHQLLLLGDKLELAKTNAALAMHDAESTGEFNPSTLVHQLIVELQELKK